jgi:hypothetical protein
MGDSMTSPTLLSDFCGTGLAAAMPASPNVPAGAMAFYYQADTTTLKLWNGSAWITAPAGVTPTIVQNNSNVGASIDSVVMGSAPTNGNLLVAICIGNTIDSPGSGWSDFAHVTTSGPSLDFHFAIYTKIAGAGESTTQQPMSSTQNCGITIYEIGSGGACSLWNDNEAQSGTATTTTLKTLGARGLIIGAVLNANATTQPSSYTGATADTGVTGGGRAQQGFHVTNPISGSNVVTANYGSSQSGVYMASVWVI